MRVNTPRFTETEKRILKLYFDGLKPKEIASSIGCSVRTVYKAVYKYRRAVREGADPAKLRSLIMDASQSADKCSIDQAGLQRGIAAIPLRGFQYPLMIAPIVPMAPSEIKEALSILKEATAQLREVAGHISKLTVEIESLRATLMRMEPELRSLKDLEEIPMVSAQENRNVLKIRGSDDLPSYLRDNPWLEILASLPRMPRYH